MKYYVGGNVYYRPFWGGVKYWLKYSVLLRWKRLDYKSGKSLGLFYALLHPYEEHMVVFPDGAFYKTRFLRTQWPLC